MPVSNLKKLFVFILPCFLFLGCHKTYTRYYDDDEAPGLAIFSNTGNDILSCLADGKPWRTVSRETSGIIVTPSPHTSYEVEITKQSTDPLRDTLVIKWYGYFQSNPASKDYLSLFLVVPPDFTYRNFAALKGQRFRLDSTLNGFFYKGPYDFQDNTGPKGNGSIYFLTATLDSIGPNTYTGKMSGVFEADFNSFKITKGRFDHDLFSGQVVF